MTANPATLWAIEYADEASWGEDSTTFDSARLLTIGVPDVNLEQPKLLPDILKQRNNDGVEGYLGPMGGTISFTLELTGHGGTAAGALTETDLNVLLGYFFGNSDAASNGGVADGVGTASAFDVDGGSEAFADGSLCRVGDPQDARGNGQFARVSDLTAGTITTLTALDAAPNDGDVVYAAQHVYPKESSNTLTSLRFQLAGPDAQYQCHGCFPMSASISGLNAGEIPQITMTFGVSWFRTPSSQLTFPVAASTDAKAAAIVSEGSFFLNDVGTATRATYGIRSFELNVERQVQPIFGVDGIDQYQVIVGARDIGTRFTATAVFDKPTAAGSAGETYTQLWSAGNLVHWLYTMSATDGRSIGIYAPRARIIGNKPTHQDVDGLTRVALELECLTNSTTTTELLAASLVMGFA